MEPICKDFLGSIKCKCLSESQDGILCGGHNCSEPLVACEGHESQNGAARIPFLSEGAHGYSCICQPGYTGSYCQTPNVFSFKTIRGFLHLQTPLLGAETYFNITLSFHTVLKNTVLFQRCSEGSHSAWSCRRHTFFLILGVTLSQTQPGGL